MSGCTAIFGGVCVRDERSSASVSADLAGVPLESVRSPAPLRVSRAASEDGRVTAEEVADTLSDENVCRWTRGIARGDRAALGHLFTARADWMVSQCRVMTGRDEHFALDILQESMLRIVRHMRAMDTLSELDRYLRSVIRTCAIDRLRADVRRLRREAARGVTDASSSSVQSPALEDIAEMERILAGLSITDRDTLFRRIARGLGFAAMAEQDATTPTIAQGRFRRLLESVQSESTLHAPGPTPPTPPTPSAKGQHP